MLLYKLIERTGEYTSYAYMLPNDENNRGIVAFFRDGTKKVVKYIEGEVKGCIAYHALTGIDVNTDVGSVAWG